jgi:hypothetical protein
MPPLISTLFDRWVSKPILVIGGGPSVLRDLLDGPELPNIACVISANAHGCRQTRFAVDLLVNVDKRHTHLKTPMEPLLRAYGIPIVNKHPWADYLLPDWEFIGNSGLTAIAVAAVLGGNPIIVTGVDMWASGREYFHDPMVISALYAEKPKHRRRIGTMISQNRASMRRLSGLVAFARGSNIRPISGPMTAVFPPFCAHATLPTPTACAYRLAHR